jgi:hypothetical protein
VSGEVCPEKAQNELDRVSIVRDDFITMLAPSTRVDCGCLTTKPREKGARHVDYRRRLSPELSANLFSGSGNW